MFPSHSTAKINDKTWMSNIPDDKKLNEITIPGTHDSCTKNLVAAIIEVYGTTQSCYLRDQLECGIRLFDLRIAYCKDVAGNLTISHSIFVARDKNEKYLSYTEDVLGDIEKFLQENPTETVLIAPGYEDGDKDVYSEHMLNWWNSVKEKKTSDGSKDLYYHETRVPTLGEVRGRIVIIRRKCMAYGKNEWKSLCSNIGISIQKLDSEETNNNEFKIENHYDVPPEPKKEFVKNYLKDCNKEDSPGNKIKIIFTSSNKPPSVGPSGMANEVNKYIKYQNFQKGKVYGWILMDFAQSPDKNIAFHEFPAYYYYLTNVFKDEEPKTYVSDLWIACVGRGCSGFSDREEAMSLIMKNRMYIDGTDIQAGRSRKFMLMGHLMSGIKDEGITGIAAVLNQKEPKINGWKWLPVKGNDENLPQNLNAGVWTSTNIYLYYTKDPAAGSPITEIKIVNSYESKSYERFEKEGWDSVCWNYSDPETADLKKGTGYDYTYCVFKRIDGSFRKSKDEASTPSKGAAQSEAKLYNAPQEVEEVPLNHEEIEFEEVEEKKSACCCCVRCNCCCCGCCICKKKLICKCCY